MCVAVPFVLEVRVHFLVFHVNKSEGEWLPCFFFFSPRSLVPSHVVLVYSFLEVHSAVALDTIPRIEPTKPMRECKASSASALNHWVGRPEKIKGNNQKRELQVTFRPYSDVPKKHKG